MATPKKQSAYIKGDQHSGGGGSAGGGGKKHRPRGGWEKGDVVRDVDTHHHGEGTPKRKPRRKPQQERGARRRHRHLGE